MRFRTLALGGALCAALAGAAAAEVKVGMITTLSGGGAGLGIDVRDGFMLAIEQSGRTDIEVIIEDDQRKPDVAVQLADKLVQSEKVDVLTGIIWSNLAMAVVPSVTAQGKFYLSPNAGPSQLAGRGCHKNYFNVAWQNDAFHEAAGKFAASEGNGKAIVIAPNYPAGKDAITGFKRGFGGEIAAEVYTKLGQTDYAAEIAQVKASGADVLYYFLPGGMGISFMKQYSGSGAEVPVIGPAFSFDQGILGAIGEAALGVKNTAHWSKDLDAPGNAEFVAAFTEKYGRLPSLYAAQGFDTGLLLVSASAKADVADADAFRAALKEADIQSVRGAFKFGENHHPIQTIYMREVVSEDGVVTNRLVGPAAVDYADPYGADCKM
ncbi:ABC transporter substrate-binding protein [Mameliella sediminis]|uniref:ABC transporter substrate-binding protein n=1 Tax=Mameliella sediminis TaxID=2836866 RepID=UPI001C43E0F3|nr:ABC transporter substrate-binding protein [Mameliella sediminis]MBV7394178.1 ABC transporter substrate-binding protein [Mameliella sediminis]